MVENPYYHSLYLELLDHLPPVCEFSDLGLPWSDPADAECGGEGSWLLVGDDLPSPLCDKHAGLIRGRLPLEALGVELVKA